MSATVGTAVQFAIEGNHIRVPTPNGQLELPLDNGLRTNAGWITADFAFDLANGWRLQNAGQAMRNAQQWNAIVPSDVMPASDFVTRPSIRAASDSGRNSVHLHLHQSPRRDGKPMPFSTSTGWLRLVAGSASTNRSRRSRISSSEEGFRPAEVALGLYFANYSQTNEWYFTDILTDVANNPFLDLTVSSGGRQIDITKNGFRTSSRIT